MVCFFKIGQKFGGQHSQINCQMSNNENTFMPKLRFSEFMNDGEWAFNEFSEYIKLYRGSSPRPIQSYIDIYS